MGIDVAKAEVHKCEVLKISVLGSGRGWDGGGGGGGEGDWGRGRHLVRICSI